MTKESKRTRCGIAALMIVAVLATTIGSTTSPASASRSATAPPAADAGTANAIPEASPTAGTPLRPAPDEPTLPDPAQQERLDSKPTSNAEVPVRAGECIDDGYEPNDTPETATPLAEDTLINAQACASNFDHFTFTPAADGNLVADMHFSSAVGDLDLELRDSTAFNFLATSYFGTDLEHVEYEVEGGTTYMLRVNGYDGAEGPYTLSFDIEHCPPDDQYEPNDTLEAATPLAEDTEFGAQICQDNDDYFGFTAQTTGNVVVDLGYSAAEGDLDLRLLNSSGELLAVSSGVDDDEHIEFSVVEDAEYVLQVDGFEGTEGPYTLLFDIPHCPPDDQYEPNDTPAEATPLAEDTEVSAQSCPFNSDMYVFTAASTGNLDVNLALDNTLGDLEMHLYDEPGTTLLASSADGTVTEHINYPVVAGTTYLLRVSGGLIAFGQAPYTLVYDIEHCPPDDQYEPNDDLNQITTPAIAVGTVLSAQACTNNLDWFSATPVLDGVISLDLSWPNDTADLTLTLHNLNEVVAVAEVTGTSAHLEYLGSAHSSYYVEVSGGETPYTLSWDQGPCPPDPFEPNDTRVTAATLAADTPIEGSICTYDDDWFAITVDERTTLVVDATSNASELNIAIELWNDAEAIASTDSFTDNEHLEHIIDVPGTYFLLVGEFTLDNVGEYGLTWTTSPAPPGAPTDVTGAAGSTQATVSWTAPATGGSPITVYNATASPGGATCTTTDTTSCVVTGLTNGTPYTFTVTATNAIGTSDPSDPSAPVTPTDCGAGPTGPFPDVPSDHPFCTDIEWLAIGGVTGGFPDGTFRPGINITRQAMAAFIYRYSGEPAFTPPAAPTFSDVPTSHPFFNEIEWLASTAITGGFEDGTFRPGASITRQAAAAFFYRLAGEPAFTPPATPTFPDVPTSHPFFKEIEWLSTTGITGGFADGTYRPGGAVTRQAFAAFLHRYDDL